MKTRGFIYGILLILGLSLNRAAYGAHLLKGVPVGNKNP